MLSEEAFAVGILAEDDEEEEMMTLENSREKEAVEEPCYFGRVKGIKDCDACYARTNCVKKGR